MVKMATVWDRSTEVLSGRGGMLAGIAIPTLFVPAVVRALYVLLATPAGAAAPTGAVAALIGGVLAILVALASLWGQLALIAAASDPTTQARDARHRASERFLPALGIAALLVLALTVLAMPPLVIAVHAGFDLTAAAGASQPLAMAPGVAAGMGLYLVVLFLVLLFVGARLVPLYAVVTNERRGLGAIARTWRLTRRHMWRIVGVLLLWGVVLVIATWAAQAVVGTVFRLILGAEGLNTVAFLVALVGAAISTVFSVIAIVFTAQLYLALSHQGRPVA